VGTFSSISLTRNRVGTEKQDVVPKEWEWRERLRRNLVWTIPRRCVR